VLQIRTPKCEIANKPTKQEQTKKPKQTKSTPRKYFVMQQQKPSLLDSCDFVFGEI